LGFEKNFFTASAVNPLVEPAPAAMNARFARQTGHMARLHLLASDDLLLT